MQELELPAGPPAERRRPRAKTLLFVAGPGRSGTSLMSGILQRLGFVVPQPEVPSDESNPRGFAESQWVVDFHTRLLRAAGVQTADARPAAWVETARVALEASVQRELRWWLRRELGSADDVLIKDPRLSWFLPLWRQCAEEVGAAPRFITVLRHPGAVVNSKQRYYGMSQSEAARTAGWLQQCLFTERGTRESPRIFVLYDELLDDWTRAVTRIGDALDLGPVKDAPAKSMRSVHEFVDQSLRRSRADWGDAAIPEQLRTHADELWELLTRLAVAGPFEQNEITARLDELREGYIRLYAEAEAIAHSSIVAARRGAAPAKPSVPFALRLARRLPRGVRHIVPLKWRVRIARALLPRGRVAGSRAA